MTKEDFKKAMLFILTTLWAIFPSIPVWVRVAIDRIVESGPIFDQFLDYLWAKFQGTQAFPKFATGLASCDFGDCPPDVKAIFDQAREEYENGASQNPDAAEVESEAPVVADAETKE